MVLIPFTYFEKYMRNKVLEFIVHVSMISHYFSISILLININSVLFLEKYCQRYTFRIFSNRLKYCSIIEMIDLDNYDASSCTEAKRISQKYILNEESNSLTSKNYH